MEFIYEDVDYDILHKRANYISKITHVCECNDDYLIKNNLFNKYAKQNPGYVIKSENNPLLTIEGSYFVLKYSNLLINMYINSDDAYGDKIKIKYADNFLLYMLIKNKMVNISDEVKAWAKKVKSTIDDSYLCWKRRLYYNRKVFYAKNKLKQPIDMLEFEKELTPKQETKYIVNVKLSYVPMSNINYYRKLECSGITKTGSLLNLVFFETPCIREFIKTYNNKVVTMVKGDKDTVYSPLFLPKNDFELEQKVMTKKRRTGIPTDFMYSAYYEYKIAELIRKM